MSIRKWAGACALATLAAGSVAAQTAAGGTVRITSAFPAGSGPDVVARLVADKLSAQWRQPVVVDPRPGGAGVVAINAMKNAPPTGNDLVVVDVGHLSINPLVLRKLAYDPQSELTPVALLYKTAFFVVVGAQSPFHSLAELMAAARRRPGMTYGSNAVGGPLHLGAARAATAMGAEMMHVPYKETSQLYAAVSTGEVDWAYGSIATSGPLQQAGKLRFLAVADSQRSPALPDVPTVQEAGGPAGIDALTWVALMAPKGTAPAVAERVNEAVNRALSAPDVRDRLAGFGFFTSIGPARQVADLMQADRERYAQVLRRVKVTVD